MKLQTIDWLKKVKMETPSTNVRQCIILKNNVYLSVQASDSHDCLPRENLPCLTQYETVEIKFVEGVGHKKLDEILHKVDWLPYEEFTRVGPYSNATKFLNFCKHNTGLYWEHLGSADVQYGCLILPQVPLDILVKIIDHLGGVIGLNDKFIKKDN